MPNVQRLLEKRVEAAIAAAFPEAAEAPALLAPAQDVKFGDYQANGAMALAKRLGKKPRDVAEQIVKRLDVADVAETPQVAGPGFINFRLDPDWVGAELGRVCADERLGVEAVEKPETVVVDYSAPNLAKEMHVGHLRSTIIGDALVRMLDFAGHKVVRQNHVGDWGTQFGMLVAYIERKQLIQPVPNWQQAFFSNKALQDLEAIYQEAKRLFDGDKEFAQEARDMVVRLQRGDPHTRNVWDAFLQVSMGHCREVYDRLGVLLTDADVRGESAYNDVLPDIVEALRKKKLLTESEGAQCVFPPGFKGKDGERLPLIVQKSDEGYLYATTDLAAIAFRTGCLPEIRNPQSAIRNSQSPHADRILYVVDARQALHFQMLFAVARQAGFAPER
ncbi:MAG TPA: arginine--tRNA ligase, partial [Phycisphaerae bacterium]|nr:arginine--tRNA ligase [Phycisphaerae bacterium]